MKHDQILELLEQLMLNRDWKLLSDNVKKHRKTLSTISKDLDHILLLHIELERLFEKEELSCVFKEGKTKELVYRIVYPAELLGPLIEQFQSLSSSVASFFLARLNVEIGEYERALKIYSELDSAGSKDVFQDFWMVERIFFKGIAFEFSGQLSNAISEYQLIFKIENKFNSIFFAFWSEKILFRLGFLLKMTLPHEAIIVFRKFLSIKASNKSKKIRAIEALIELLEIHSNVTSEVEDEIVHLILDWDRLQDKEMDTKLTEPTAMNRLNKIYPILSKYRRYPQIIAICKEMFHLTIVHNEVYKIMLLAYYSDGNMSDALKAGKEYMTLKGNDPFAIILVAKLYLKLNCDPNLAIKCLESDHLKTSSMLKPKRFCLLASCYFLLKNFDKAAECISTSLYLDTEDYFSHFVGAMIDVAVGNWESAQKSIKQSLKLNSNFSAGWHLLAFVKSGLNDFDSAIKACDAALSETERKIDILMTKAALTMKHENSSNALLIFKSIFSIYSENNSSLTFEELFDLWIGCSVAFRKLANFEDCLNALEEAGKIFPDRSDLLYHHARLLEERGMLDESIEKYIASLLIANSVDANMGLARVFFKKEDLDKSSFYTERVLDIQPNCSEALLLKGKLSKKNGAVDEARVLFLKALRQEVATPVRPLSIIKLPELL